MEKFLKNFADQLDNTDINTLSPQTKFRDIDEWSSLTALSVIAMVDEEYDVVLKGDDMQKAQTIEDIFNIILSK